MTRIESIYKRVFHELPESRQEDDALAARIKEEVESMEGDPEEKERLSDIMFIGSSYGQVSGFISGFRFAIALMFESLV